MSNTKHDATLPRRVILPLYTSPLHQRDYLRITADVTYDLQMQHCGSFDVGTNKHERWCLQCQLPPMKLVLRSSKYTIVPTQGFTRHKTSRSADLPPHYNHHSSAERQFLTTYLLWFQGTGRTNTCPEPGNPWTFIYYRRLMIGLRLDDFLIPSSLPRRQSR
jgi:hypothetical protein